MRSPAGRITVAILAFAALCGRAAAAPDGKQLYLAKCATCHGPNGEGTKRYKQRLEGDRSPAQLADVIRRTMPEDDPESLTPEESAAVANYTHAAFYSSLARERNRPARIELARLTAQQHRNALADLVGGFRWPGPWGPPERGLKGEYFPAGRANAVKLALERTDGPVSFDFGFESPVPDKLDPLRFTIHWSGSVLAPETGEYEFTVRTVNAAQLWVNDLNRPLIDAMVKSGDETEHKGRIFLVGGRYYPVRLHFIKGGRSPLTPKDKDKAKPSPASVALLWAVPNRPPVVIPDRHLTPHPAPEGFACTAPFPPDDRSYGWERGTSVSAEWDQATTDAAIETAAYVGEKLNELAGTRPDAPDRAKKLRGFAGAFAERAFRRPLTAEQTAIVDRLFAAADPDAGVKRVVLWALKSPRFLYREAGSGPDAYDTAARLSFALWDSIPDNDLLRAAAENRLSTPDQVRQQAWRMLSHPAGRAKLKSFLLTWLKVAGGHDLAKDPKTYPGFDPTVIADLRTSLELFLDDVVWSDRSDFRELLLSDEVFLNGRLAEFYGADAPTGDGFEKVTLDPGRRAGVLTHPYLMASFAHSAESSPIHRGVFLARGLLGVAMKPPPEAVAPLAPDLHPTLTTRERVALQTKAAACMTCHGVINPLGFTLENLDAVGRFRTADHGKPVDPVGAYTTRSGKTVTIAGPRELGAFLADSEEAHAAFCEQMFHHYARQPLRAYGPDTLDDLRRRFVGGGLNVRNLAVEVAVTAALPPRAEAVSRAK